jgi:4,5-DOPA dioxygenase extradiol
MKDNMPTIFVSHGAPSLLLDRDPTFHFFKELGRLIPFPKAILCVSAHWETYNPTVTGNSQPETIHDFFGFPKALYDIEYPAPGDYRLAQTVREMIIGAGFKCDVDKGRGLDHGTWVPLKLMYPSAEIPTIQLSVQTAKGGTDHHLKIGKTLQSLRQHGVLILGSGGATHNLHELGRYPINDSPQPYAVEFDAWLCESIQNASDEDLLNYKKRAPSAARNHPTDEHFLPLFVPLGAGGKGTKGKQLHQGFTYGLFSMAAYAWGI